jgi:hypothetical protein
MAARRLLIVPLVVIAAVLATGASATESTITPGVGIGKIRTGMTLKQVEKVFGAGFLVNARANVGGMAYVDRGWEFGSWSVGFLRHDKTQQVAQIATTLRGEKTRKGIGVGSLFKAVVRAYPQAICVGYYTTMGGSVPTGFGAGQRGSAVALVVAKDRLQMSFLVQSTSKYYDPTKPWYVYEVIVRHSVPSAVDFVPKSRCDEGWQGRGQPYRPH